MHTHIHTGGYLTEREGGGRENSVCFLKICIIWPLLWPYWCCNYSNWDPQVTHTLRAQISYLCVVLSTGCSRFFVVNKFHCFLFCPHVSFSRFLLHHLSYHISIQPKVHIFFGSFIFHFQQSRSEEKLISGYLCDSFHSQHTLIYLVLCCYEPYTSMLEVKKIKQVNSDAFIIRFAFILPSELSLCPGDHLAVSFHVSQISAFFLQQVLKIIENNIFNGINIMLLSRCLMTSFQIPKKGTLDTLLKSEIFFYF